ncbi:DUF2950 family protein [Caballeronia sp. LZ034LL]|uniref:DUF2950 family protein n=1 Tax=Caballeronia sp. LZ034LL TaxID=3038567 RepID=UPI002867387A|nr:DUF2950 family protein [Caballeronia sp. LZ034LL]MDR5833521.1 DUF2950 family protein [Caballeronia sp. LZ034LL]
MTPIHTFALPKKALLGAVLAASFASFAFSATMAHAQAASQAVYPSTEAAAQALTDAIASNDERALSIVLGKDHAHYVPTDSIGEQDNYAYLGAWAQQHRIVDDPQPLDGRPAAHIEVGTSGWTLPIPLVKVASGWRFDMPAARDEVLTRRIGRNERSAMQVALAYVAAQKEFHDKQGRYADRFVSTPGKHDGLYWETAAGEPESPLGPLAAEMPNKPSAADGYYGYHYRILSAQGGGVGLIATPARYGQTGVMSFLVKQDGQLFEKDLGAKSAELASKVSLTAPGASWRPVAP